MANAASGSCKTCQHVQDFYNFFERKTKKLLSFHGAACFIVSSHDPVALHLLESKTNKFPAHSQLPLWWELILRWATEQAKKWNMETWSVGYRFGRLCYHYTTHTHTSFLSEHIVSLFISTRLHFALMSFYLWTFSCLYIYLLLPGELLLDLHRLTGVKLDPEAHGVGLLSCWKQNKRKSS